MRWYSQHRLPSLRRGTVHMVSIGLAQVPAVADTMGLSARGAASACRRRAFEHLPLSACIYLPFRRVGWPLNQWSLKEV